MITHRTKIYKLFPSGSWFFRYWKVYDASPTDFEKWFFSIFLKKNHFFQKMFCIFFLVIQKSIYWWAKQKTSKLFWWILLGFLLKGIKARQNAKKGTVFMYTYWVIFQKVVFFQWSKYIKNDGENTTFTKKSWISNTKTVPFFSSQKLKKWNFTQLWGKISKWR